MSLLKSFTEEEKELLVNHGLSSSEHSQLSDSFVIGLRHARSEYNKIKADAVREFLNENVPIFDDESLDPDLHHCEFTLLEERKRLHGLVKKLERGDL